MISVLSTNITSPLGFTTEQNYQAVLSGNSALKRYEGLWGLPEPFAASLFSEEQKRELALDGHTFFEALAIHSAREALTHIQLDVASPRVVFPAPIGPESFTSPVRSSKLNSCVPYIERKFVTLILCILIEYYSINEIVYIIKRRLL